MFSKAILIGNLGKDPELRTLQDGRGVARMRLAVSDMVKGPNGQKTEVTVWWEIEAWGQLADLVGRQGRKGRQAFVEGRMVFESWHDRDNQARETKKVIADSIRFLGGKAEKDQHASGAPAPAAAPPPAPAGATAPAAPPAAATPPAPPAPSTTSKGEPAPLPDVGEQLSDTEPVDPYPEDSDEAPSSGIRFLAKG